MASFKKALKISCTGHLLGGLSGTPVSSDLFAWDV